MSTQYKILILVFVLNVQFHIEENISMNSSNVITELTNFTLGLNSTEIIQDEERPIGFLHGFLEALGVVLVSEIGDKTFFIAAIMAMTNDKIVVFLGAILSLAFMTILSALLGFAITRVVPHIYTYYACSVIMFLFGIKMLWDGYKMNPEEAAEIQHEVEHDIAERQDNVSVHSVLENQESKPEVLTKRRGWIGIKHCVKIFKVFLNCFIMTFLAEWGDRSQLATIVLASANDLAGVILGGITGHTICSAGAVIAGAVVASKISVRTVTLGGGILFLGLAVISLFLYEPQPEQQ